MRRVRGSLAVVITMVAGTLAVVLASAAPVAAARTGTVVFVRDHDVWIMPADNPAAAGALTDDGTADAPYAIPAADDFGNVYAVTNGGFGDIVRLDHFGNLRGVVPKPWISFAAIDAIRPSPNGEILAITTVQTTSPSGLPLPFPVFFVYFAYADGRPSTGLGSIGGAGYAVWYDDDSVYFHPSVVSDDDWIDGYETFTIGADDSQPWFPTCHRDDILTPACNLVVVSDLTRDRTRLAAIDNTNDSDEPVRIVSYELTGAPPAQPRRDCRYDGPINQGTFLNVASSPDGDGLMWDYTGTLETPAPAGAGLYLATGFTTRSCAAAFGTATLVMPGATQPFWSSAPYGTLAPGGGGGTGDYAPLQPERLLDTRAESPVGYSGPKPGPGAVVELDVTGVGASNLPDTAEAVAINLTGVEPTADGYVTVWPCGQPRPTAANLNLTPGRISPNLVIARVGANGRICLFTQSGTHLVADVAGYFPAGSTYEPLQPERLLDTRAESPVGYGGPKPGAGGVVELDVTGVGASNLPDNAAAVAINLTGVEPTADGYVTVWPCGQPRPTAANLNLTPGRISPNSVIARVGANGRICLFTQSGTHLVADLAGYFPAGSTYEPLQPERLLDTRAESRVGYGGPKPGAGGVVELDVTGVGASNVPDTAVAVAINLTGVEPTADGYVTVWPCGQPRPTAANLNLTPGTISPNSVIATIGANGRICIFTQSGTHLVADLAGYL